MKKDIPTYEELLRPLTPFTYRWFKWRIVGFILNTIGRLSKGIRLGFRYGFDSGRMLDYVYENKAQGALIIGKLIDKDYLNGPGWKGIRQRKANLKELIKDVFNYRVGNRTVIMDLASGPGRYLLEIITDNPDKDIEVICRDMSEDGLTQGRMLAEKTGIKNIKYERADAFNPEDLKNSSPRPNLIIVSGLYELFTDDRVIMKSIKDIYSTLSSGDYFIFTNQPYHPQLELIARVLPNRLGKLWVMKLRPDEQMQSWAKEAGFSCIKTLVDEAGIFSVTLVKKA